MIFDHFDLRIPRFHVRHTNGEYFMIFLQFLDQRFVQLNNVHGNFEFIFDIG